MAPKAPTLDAPELDELEQEEQQEQAEAKRKVLALRRQLRQQFNLPVTAAQALAERIERAAANGIVVTVDSLVGLTFYRSNPVFDPGPKVGDPRRQLIDLSKLNRAQILEWLQLQGTREINVALDDNDRRLDRSGVTIAPRHFQFHGVIWPVKKGRSQAVPWPIAEIWDDAGDEAANREQFANILRRDPEIPAQYQP